jgi:hypothetical protein
MMRSQSCMIMWIHTLLMINSTLICLWLFDCASHYIHEDDGLWMHEFWWTSPLTAPQ